jgi:hypothetical protein
MQGRNILKIRSPASKSDTLAKYFSQTYFYDLPQLSASFQYAILDTTLYFNSPSDAWSMIDGLSKSKFLFALKMIKPQYSYKVRIHFPSQLNFDWRLKELRSKYPDVYL